MEATTTDTNWGEYDPLIAALTEPLTTQEVVDIEQAISHFNYTTIALRAIAVSLLNLEDFEGAKLVRDFSERMAEHEAKTV